MQRNFSWKTTVIFGLLSSAMLGMAAWQWDRHLWKIQLIEELTRNLNEAPQPLLSLPAANGSAPWSSVLFRRVTISGSFDFAHEVIIKNRRLGALAGFHVLTPLLLDGTDARVLVNRGFIPLGTETLEVRKQFQSPSHISATGLIKEAARPKMFSPSDGEVGGEAPWLDSWLRVDVEKMQKQLPYPVLPVYLELVANESAEKLARDIIRESEAGRGEILMYTGKRSIENQGLASATVAYPLPAHDSTPPPDIHLGYVWEWSFLALLTAAIGAIIQMPRPSRLETTIQCADVSPSNTLKRH